MMFAIEFFRIREKDNAHAMLDRITHVAPDLESAKVKAISLFDTLNLPQNPDGLRSFFGPRGWMMLAARRARSFATDSRGYRRG
jgi:hypothetical protein